MLKHHPRRCGAGAALLGAAAFAFAAQSASAGVPTYSLAPFAGSGSAGAPVAGTATSSPLGRPEGVALDSAGDVYIVDWSNNMVVEVAPSGTLSILPTASNLNQPVGVATDASGDVYIADANNNDIPEVTPAGAYSIFAGITGTFGPFTPGPSPQSAIGVPWGVAVDPSGDVYIADVARQQIYKVAAGTLSVIAGSAFTSGTPTPGPATSSDVNNPSMMTTDAAGDLFIADSTNDTIDEITPAGILSVVAGIPGSAGVPTDGPALSSHLDAPYGVAVDAGGDLYIADTSNEDVEEVTPDGNLTVIAGDNTLGTATFGVPATTSDFEGPYDIASTPAGRLYVSDADDHQVDLLIPPATTALTAPTISGTTTAGQTLTATKGTWTNDPIVFAYQWEDCDSTGANCSVIAGASSSTYVTQASDAGHTIRVVVTASNGGGSATQTSAATTELTAPVLAPILVPILATLPLNDYTVVGATAGPNGTIVVRVRVPAAGVVRMLGTHQDVRPASVASTLLYPGHDRFEWARASGTATAAGTVAITSHPDKAGRALLARHRRHGWALSVVVWTTYTPVGGYPRSHSTVVKVLSAAHR